MKRSKKFLCFGCIATITLTAAVILDNGRSNIFAEEQNYSLIFSSTSNKLKTVEMVHIPHIQPLMVELNLDIHL